MNRMGSLRNSENPNFYRQLGELIVSTGDDLFANNMYQLVDGLIPINRVELSEWTLDERQPGAATINTLGYAGLSQPFVPPDALESPTDHPLLQKMIEMDDSLLIQLNVSHQHTSAQHPLHRSNIHQCNLVSRNANRRCVIAFYRFHDQQVFSLPELSFLKNLSDTLLPLIERHAQISRKAAVPMARAPLSSPELTPLPQAFDERLALSDISLSAREKEVCLGLLTGSTVPQMAERLRVKNSSIETYLKRSTAKLGASGRHGLVKWMAGA